MDLKAILSAIRKADKDFDLIEDNDRIALALSGGKDSMLLFLALHMYQKFEDKNFSLIGIHVDVGFEEYENELMKQFASQHDLDLHIEKTQIFDILKQHLTKKETINCSLCSTLKKGVLFDKAKEFGCNKVAYGHHGDDAIETLIMNMMYGSKIATFQPKQYMSRQKMDLIRPMIYLKEKEVIKACKKNEIPSVKRVCPNDGFTQRQAIKDQLTKWYQEYPFAHDAFLKSLSNTDQLALWHKKILK